MTDWTQSPESPRMSVVLLVEGQIAEGHYAGIVNPKEAVVMLKGALEALGNIGRVDLVDILEVDVEKVGTTKDVALHAPTLDNAKLDVRMELTQEDVETEVTIARRNPDATGVVRMYVRRVQVLETQALEALTISVTHVEQGNPRIQITTQINYYPKEESPVDRLVVTSTDAFNRVVQPDELPVELNSLIGISESDAMWKLAELAGLVLSS